MSIVYGYAKSTMYAGTGEFMIQVRIPNIHGPIDQRDYRGQKVKNYVKDENLPWYPALLMPHTPNTNEVVVLMSTNSSNSEFIVIGLTGGQYSPISIDES